MLRYYHILLLRIIIFLKFVSFAPNLAQYSAPVGNYNNYHNNPIRLLGSVIPFWVLEPQDTFVVKQNPATLECAAKNARDIVFKCNDEDMAKYQYLTETYRDPLSNEIILKTAIDITRAQVEEFYGPNGYHCSCLAVGGSYDEPSKTISRSALVQIASLKKYFEKQPVSISTEVNSTVELQCLPPYGLPKPEVFWMKDGIPLDVDKDPNLILSSEGSLLISMASLRDRGNYSCVAKNIANQRSTEPASLNVYVNGGWSDWTEWPSCIDNCEKGFRKRYRFCTNPKPINNGRDCLGPAVQRESCDMYCPVNGGWTQWSLWSQCSKDCKAYRRRSCTNPSPLNGGQDCGYLDGSLPFQIANCSGDFCGSDNGPFRLLLTSEGGDNSIVSSDFNDEHLIDIIKGQIVDDGDTNMETNTNAIENDENFHGLSPDFTVSTDRAGNHRINLPTPDTNKLILYIGIALCTIILIICLIFIFAYAYKKYNGRKNRQHTQPYAFDYEATNTFSPYMNGASHLLLGLEREFKNFPLDHKNIGDFSPHISNTSSDTNDKVSTPNPKKDSKYGKHKNYGKNGKWYDPYHYESINTLNTKKDEKDKTLNSIESGIGSSAYNDSRKCSSSMYLKRDPKAIMLPGKAKSQASDLAQEQIDKLEKFLLMNQATVFRNPSPVFSQDSPNMSSYRADNQNEKRQFFENYYSAQPNFCCNNNVNNQLTTSNIAYTTKNLDLCQTSSTTYYASVPLTNNTYCNDTNLNYIPSSECKDCLTHDHCTISHNINKYNCNNDCVQTQVCDWIDHKGSTLRLDNFGITAMIPSDCFENSKDAIHVVLSCSPCANVNEYVQSFLPSLTTSLTPITTIRIHNDTKTNFYFKKPMVLTFNLDSASICDPNPKQSIKILHANPDTKDWRVLATLGEETIDTPIYCHLNYDATTDQYQFHILTEMTGNYCVVKIEQNSSHTSSAQHQQHCSVQTSFSHYKLENKPNDAEWTAINSTTSKNYDDNKMRNFRKILKEICPLLDKPRADGKDWRLLAKHLKIDRYIQYFAARPSPTDTLLTLWESLNRNQTTTLTDEHQSSTFDQLKTILSKMDRNDVCLIMENYIE